MGMIALGAMAAGMVYQGMAASAEGKSAQNMADYNAELAMRNKAQIEARGKEESILQAKSASRQESKLLASLGASGAVVQAGTPLDILAEQAAESERENLAIGYDTQVAAQQQESQAELDRLSGDVARQRGRNQATASYIGAGATLLSGFGSSSSKAGSFTDSLTQKQKTSRAAQLRY